MAEEILPFAWNAYNEMGNDLGVRVISQKNIVDFFPSPQMRLSFLDRIKEDNTYVSKCPEPNYFIPLFNYEFGCGEIKPVYLVQLDSLLPAWRHRLISGGQLIEEDFKIKDLIVAKDKIQYKELTASAIIFCDGYSLVNNPYFNLLPFAPNKGEALIIDIPDLPNDKIYKKGMVLAPLQDRGSLWWVGSNYAWEFDHEDPTKEFRDNTERQLKEWLRLPFKITDHLAGIRPATLERRPFAGLHPLYPSIGLLNGMGTKGCSLAPFFANQFVHHLLYNEAITPEADIKRFTGILSKNRSRL
jgi:glycine/D-amino acid oxidase-like deaminating enzyme